MKTIKHEVKIKTNGKYCSKKCKYLNNRIINWTACNLFIKRLKYDEMIEFGKAHLRCKQCLKLDNK